MKKLRQILIVGMVLACLGMPVLAGSAWNEADTSSPFAIRYADADNVGTITVTTNTILLVDDSYTNTITFSAAAAMNTLGEVLAAVNSATNITGGKNFEAVYWCGVAADTVTNNYLVALAATTLTRQWNYGVKWDTSTCKHYDSAVGVMIQTTPVGAGKIDRIFGDPIGTGNVQLTVYVDGDIRWKRLITSPIYVMGSLYTNPVANASVAFDYAVDLPFGTQPAFIRAARATTATTGGIGISDTRR